LQIHCEHVRKATIHQKGEIANEVFTEAMEEVLTISARRLNQERKEVPDEGDENETSPSTKHQKRRWSKPKQRQTRRVSFAQKYSTTSTDRRTKNLNLLRKTCCTIVQINEYSRHYIPIVRTCIKLKIMKVQTENIDFLEIPF
jgi:hypothetical protein